MGGKEGGDGFDGNTKEGRMDEEGEGIGEGVMRKEWNYFGFFMIMSFFWFVIYLCEE